MSCPQEPVAKHRGATGRPNDANNIDQTRRRNKAARTSQPLRARADPELANTARHRLRIGQIRPKLLKSRAREPTWAPSRGASKRVGPAPWGVDQGTRRRLVGANWGSCRKWAMNVRIWISRLHPTPLARLSHMLVRCLRLVSPRNTHTNTLISTHGSCTEYATTMRLRRATCAAKEFSTCARRTTLRRPGRRKTLKKWSSMTPRN